MRVRSRARLSSPPGPRGLRRWRLLLLGHRDRLVPRGAEALRAERVLVVIQLVVEVVSRRERERCTEDECCRSDTGEN